MKKEALLVLLVLTFFGVDDTLAQERITAKLEYHSALEQELVQSYFDGNGLNMLSLQLITDNETNKNELRQYAVELESFINKLNNKKEKFGDEKRFYSHVFYKTHQKFLKQYIPFSSLRTLFQKGAYDCLSATSLYALILEALGADYQIIETNYHIYLKIRAGSDLVLFESTDPVRGFTSDPKEIEARLNGYRQGNLALNASNTEQKSYYQYATAINNSITLHHMVGLHYYNEAVSAYNNKELKEAIDYLVKAAAFHSSDRIIEFSALVSKAILMTNEINSNEKAIYLKRLNQVLSVMPAIASR